MNEVRAAQDMWNKALAKLPAHGCFDVKVVFDAHLLDKGDPRDPGYDQVTIIFDKPGRSEVVGGDGAQNDDFVAGYTETLNGTFYGSDMTTGTWAHEIGHMMGLKDDYYQQRHGFFHPAGSCLPGRAGTLMCNDNTGKIDQNLADRLADILNKDGVLPQCWIGTLKGHGPRQRLQRYSGGDLPFCRGEQRQCHQGQGACHDDPCSAAFHPLHLYAPSIAGPIRREHRRQAGTRTRRIVQTGA